MTRWFRRTLMLRLGGIALFALAIAVALYSELSGLFWSSGLIGQASYTVLSFILAGVGVIFMMQPSSAVSPPGLEKQEKKR